MFSSGWWIAAGVVVLSFVVLGAWSNRATGDGGRRGRRKPDVGGGDAGVVDVDAGERRPRDPLRDVTDGRWDNGDSNGDGDGGDGGGDGGGGGGGGD